VSDQHEQLFRSVRCPFCCASFTVQDQTKCLQERVAELELVRDNLAIMLRRVLRAGSLPEKLEQ